MGFWPKGAKTGKKYLLVSIHLPLGRPAKEKSDVRSRAKKVQVNIGKASFFKKSQIRPNKRQVVSWSWMSTKCHQIWSKVSSEHDQSLILIQFLPKKSFWFSKSCCKKTCFQLADVLSFWACQKCLKNASTAHLSDRPKVRNIHFWMPQDVGKAVEKEFFQNSNISIFAWWDCRQVISPSVPRWKIGENWLKRWPVF